MHAIDVAITTGDGKFRPDDLCTPIFKCNIEVNYLLKIKVSRYVLLEADKKFPFMIYYFED